MRTRRVASRERQTVNQLSDAALDCNDSASLAKFIENALSEHFQEADDVATERFSGLERKKKVDTMQSALNRQTEQLKSLHATVGKIDSRVIELETDCAQYQTTLVKYDDKLTQLKDRARRDNILSINLKEGIESSNVRQYLLASIPKLYPALADQPPEIMRAHRVGAPRDASSHPRPPILKCLRCTDRDRILNESRRHPVQVAGHQIKFAPDYSEATSKRRKPCYPVMNRARKGGFQAFPARISLKRTGECYTFEDVGKASAFLDSEEANGATDAE